MLNTYTLLPCEPCQPFFVATRTYVAECGNGSVGEKVSVTRQARSIYSEAHAAVLALNLAKAEAEMEIICLFTETQCLPVSCGQFQYAPVCRTATSAKSQADALAKSMEAAVIARSIYCS